MNNVLTFDSRGRRRSVDRTRPGDVLTVPQTAALLGLSVNTTYVYLANGTIPGQRVGRRWIISRARLDSWLSGQIEEAR